MEKIDHHCVIQYFHLKGLSPTNSKAELDSSLGESALPFTIIKYWVAELKRDHTSCQDEHHSGRPNEVTTTEIVKKIHKMVLDNRQLKVRELADMLTISKSAVNRILTENLDMRKLCARWLPRLLTMKQKQRRDDVSMECIKNFNLGKIKLHSNFCIGSIILFVRFFFQNLNVYLRKTCTIVLFKVVPI